MSGALLVLFALLAWAAILTAVGAVPRLRRGRPTAEGVEMEESRARYARAEVPHAEYDRRRREFRERMPRPRPLARAGTETSGAHSPK